MKRTISRATTRQTFLTARRVFDPKVPAAYEFNGEPVNVHDFIKEHRKEFIIGDERSILSLQPGWEIRFDNASRDSPVLARVS